MTKIERKVMEEEVAKVASAEKQTGQENCQDLVERMKKTIFSCPDFITN
jgi:hypothetical protein